MQELFEQVTRCNEAFSYLQNCYWKSVQCEKLANKMLRDGHDDSEMIIKLQEQLRDFTMKVKPLTLKETHPLSGMFPPVTTTPWNEPRVYSAPPVVAPPPPPQYKRQPHIQHRRLYAPVRLPKQHPAPPPPPPQKEEEEQGEVEEGEQEPMDNNDLIPVTLFFHGEEHSRQYYADEHTNVISKLKELINDEQIHALFQANELGHVAFVIRTKYLHITPQDFRANILVNGVTVTIRLYDENGQVLPYSNRIGNASSVTVTI